MRCALRTALIFTLGITALIAYGWRYGYTRLPAAGTVPLHLPTPYSESELTPKHAWYWMRHLESHPLPGSTSSDVLWSRLRQWGTQRPAGPTPTTELATVGFEVLQSPEHLELVDRLIACEIPSSRLPDLALAGQWAAEVNSVLLGQLWLASAAERKGRSTDAFRHVIQGWQIWIRLLPVSPAGGDFPAQAARTWERLALTGDPISPTSAAPLLAATDELSRQLPPPIAFFGRMVTFAQAGASESGLHGLDLAQVGDDLHEALSNIRHEWRALGEQTVDRLRGQAGSSDLEFLGIRRFAPALQRLIEGCQRALGRPQDCASLRDAYLRHVTEALVSEGFESAQRLAREWTESPTRQPTWRRWLDRPAAWSSLSELPDLSFTERRLTAWWAAFQGCRLTLAARLFRDREGEWPVSLAELTPDLLASLPSDPLNRTEFRYHRSGDVWGLAVGLASSPLLPRRPLDFCFLSSELFPTDTLSGSARATPSALMLLLRYGLIPGRPDPEHPGHTNLILRHSSSAESARLSNSIEVLKGLGSLPTNLVVRSSQAEVDLPPD